MTDEERDDEMMALTRPQAARSAWMPADDRLRALDRFHHLLSNLHEQTGRRPSSYAMMACASAVDEIMAAETLAYRGGTISAVAEMLAAAARSLRDAERFERRRGRR